MRLEGLESTSILIDPIGLELRPAFEPVAAEPDALREAVFKALSSISADERSDFRDRLLAGFSSVRLNVRACLLMLGASAATADELTAPEIASLIRYVRLNEPKAMMAVAAPLGELLAAAESAQAAPDLAA